jgi:hypothetical protein
VDLVRKAMALWLRGLGVGSQPCVCAHFFGLHMSAGGWCRSGMLAGPTAWVGGEDWRARDPGLLGMGPCLLIGCWSHFLMGLVSDSGLRNDLAWVCWLELDCFRGFLHYLTPNVYIRVCIVSLSFFLFRCVDCWVVYKWAMLVSLFSDVQSSSLSGSCSLHKESTIVCLSA